jgi:DNA polymerase-3 subunit epsilon
VNVPSEEPTEDDGSDVAPPLEEGPPSGPPWDLPIAEAPFAFLDLEMTGLDARLHHVCELAVRRVRGGVVEAELVSLVRPRSAVAESQKIHQLDDAMLADAPSLESRRGELAALLDGAVLVGHGLAADLDFLSAAAERGELEPPPRFALDTLALARRAVFSSSYKLGALAKALRLPLPSHRALADVVTTMALFDHLCRELRAPTPRALWQVRAGEKRASMRDDVRAALERAVATTKHARLRYRVPHRQPFEDVLCIHELEPAHVQGRLLQRGNTRRLRGDRILWAEIAERPER